MLHQSTSSFLICHILSNFKAYALMFLLPEICPSTYHLISRFMFLRCHLSERPHILYHLIFTCIEFITI